MLFNVIWHDKSCVLLTVCVAMVNQGKVQNKGQFLLQFNWILFDIVLKQKHQWTNVHKRFIKTTTHNSVYHWIYYSFEFYARVAMWCTHDSRKHPSRLNKCRWSSCGRSNTPRLCCWGGQLECDTPWVEAGCILWQETLKWKVIKRSISNLGLKYLMYFY